MTAFEEFGVLPEIGKAVEEMDWTLPTDVQSEAIPLILGGGDVLMAAETGSGKTGAFCLPILQTVWETLKDIDTSKGSIKKGEPPKSALWEMSKTDRTPAMAISADGLVCQAREFKDWHGCRSNKGVANGGKHYYEAKVTDEGLCRVGWSSTQASLILGTDRSGFGFGGTGNKSNDKRFDNYGESFGMNDIIGCLLDLDSGRILFSKNGNNLGEAFVIPKNLLRTPLYPALCLKNAEITFNFGSKPLKYVPDGYKPICDADPSFVKENELNTSGKTPIKRVHNAPQALIIEPSRELAEQTCQQIIKFKKFLDKPTVKELLVVGGVNIKDQLNSIEEGVDIVVATPGRLEDFIGKNFLSLSQCRFFVLDEADGLLKQGYKDLIHRIYKKIPKYTPDGKRMQMIVCSATLHDFEVKKLADTLMNFPTWIDLKGEDAVPETVHHVVVTVDPRKDLRWESLQKHVQTDGVHFNDNVKHGMRSDEALSEAVKILKAEYAVKAIKEHHIDRAIIFCRTKVDCDNMEKYLRALGTGLGRDSPYSCVSLHGDRKPAERKSNYESFKNGLVKFLICTDVAARGIDISSLPFVLNITLPDDKSNYVHRIGRVGRADRMGLAISFVSAVKEKVWYHGEWCHSRGRDCYNTSLTDKGGCCIWYNEPQYLADIEDHLKITIDQVGPDLAIPKNEFDGKVTYGQKRTNAGTGYKDHVTQMAPAVSELAGLESKAQVFYLKRYFKVGA